MGSRARMLVNLCVQECSKVDSTEGESLASNPITSTNTSTINEIFSAEQKQQQDSNVISNIGTNCSSQPSTVTENVISSLYNTDPTPIANHEHESEGETKDFSADDSGDEYKLI